MRLFFQLGLSQPFALSRAVTGMAFASGRCAVLLKERGIRSRHIGPSRELAGLCRYFHL